MKHKLYKLSKSYAVMPKARFPYFKFMKWTKIAFRFTSFEPLFRGKYYGKDLNYFSVQEKWEGNVYLVGFTDNDLQKILKAFDENYITSANYRDYLFYFWNSPKRSFKKDSEKSLYWSVDIDKIEKIKPKMKKNLDVRYHLIQNKGVSSKYL